MPTLPSVSSFFFGNTSVNPAEATALVTGAGIPYRYSKPKNMVAGQKYAVVFFFHGVGEEGTDGIKHLAADNGTAHGALYMLSTANPDNADMFPCFFIAPQIPAGANWSDDRAAAWVCSLIKTFTTVYGSSIDTTSFYQTGLSQGGFGTYDQPYEQMKPQFLGYQPYAALVPMSGNIGEYAPRPATSQPKVPIWRFHGVQDPTVPITKDDADCATMLAAGHQIISTRYANGVHDIWESAFQHPLLLPWMFSQRLGQPSPGLPNNWAVVDGAVQNLGGITVDGSSASAVTPPPPTTTNVALNKKVTVSSTDGPANAAANAVDGNPATRWSSQYNDPQWIEIDLGANYAISEIDLNWEAAAGKNYFIRTSMDGTAWTTQTTVTGNASTGILKYPYATPVTARYVQVYGTARLSGFGYSLWEVAVYGIAV